MNEEYVLEIPNKPIKSGWWYSFYKDHSNFIIIRLYGIDRALAKYNAGFRIVKINAPAGNNTIRQIVFDSEEDRTFFCLEWMRDASE